MTLDVFDLREVGAAIRRVEARARERASRAKLDLLDPRDRDQVRGEDLVDELERHGLQVVRNGR